jgi:hypothetical protein
MAPEYIKINNGQNFKRNELSPLQLSPFRSNNPSLCSSNTSTSTNCQDEKETLNDININIYTIYGILS